MLVLNLDTGKENIFSPNTSAYYALAYTAAFDEGLLNNEFWDMDKEQLYMALPFSSSIRLDHQIIYLGDNSNLGATPLYGTTRTIS